MTGKYCKFAFAFAAATVAVVGYFALNFPTMYARVKMDRSYPALARYLFEPTPDIVLVGSSMTYRLYEGYFQTPVRNLAIGGGSPLTGLAIIASYDKLPRIVLVETNILSRPVDADLVSAFGPNEPFRWIRAVVSKFYYWAKYQTENVQLLLQTAPMQHDISASVSEAQRDYDGHNHDAEMGANVETLRKLVLQLERRGCRVTFFEMPFPPPLGQSHYAAMARTLARTKLPNVRWVIPAVSEQDDLRWLDAAHLDERSAAIFSQALEKAISASR